MDTSLSSTTIIRQRAQITIPDQIRKHLSWVQPNKAVNISVRTADEIVIKPHSSQKEVDWKKLRKQIKRVRAFKGRGKPISLSEFIVKDRETHF